VSSGLLLLTGILLFRVTHPALAAAKLQRINQSEIKRSKKNVHYRSWLAHLIQLKLRRKVVKTISIDLEDLLTANTFCHIIPSKYKIKN